jgi:hypothetical protein
VTATMVRVIRAPFFLLNLLVGAALVCFFLAWVSVGDWCQDALRRLGYREHPDWLPGALGVAAYVSLGIAGPAYLGYTLVGWPGVIAGPLLALAIIAILGRW